MGVTPHKKPRPSRQITRGAWLLFITPLAMLAERAGSMSYEKETDEDGGGQREKHIDANLDAAQVSGQRCQPPGLLVLPLPYALCAFKDAVSQLPAFTLNALPAARDFRADGAELSLHIAAQVIMPFLYGILLRLVVLFKPQDVAV